MIINNSDYIELYCDIAESLLKALYDIDLLRQNWSVSDLSEADQNKFVECTNMAIAMLEQYGIGEAECI
jgi:hypothetical protein